MNQRRLMVVAGGDWQVPLIQKAKAMGLFVINTNLHSNSPGFRYSDIGLVADVLDRKTQLQFAKEHRPHGIVTDQSDLAVPTVAYLCEALGLPGIGMSSAGLFTNKPEMRRFLRQHGFPTPDFQLCQTPDHAARFAAQIGYPAVLKPPANQSSRGVFKVSNEDELLHRYPDTLQFAHSGEVLVEKFLNGPELTVEGLKSHERHYSLAISCKEHYPHNPMVASQLYYSPTNRDIDYNTLKRQHDALVEQMGLPFGITHAEYIFAEGQFFLVEVAARGGGTKISSDIVPAISGVSTNELLIRMSLGERLECVSVPENHCRFGLLGFLNFDSGVVRAVSGIDHVRSLPGVLDIAMNFQPGDRIEPPADDRARHGYFIVITDSSKALQSLCQRVRAEVKVSYA